MNFNKNKVKVYPYHKFSESAKAIAQAFGVKRLKRENSRWRPTEDSVVINWGSTKLPAHLDNDEVLILNHPDDVKKASNKLKFFEYLNGTKLTPLYTTSKAQAEMWINSGKKVCVRETVTGHEGQGLSVVDSKAELKDAPLYTLYVPKKDEYRVHVVNDEAISVQRKARRLNCEQPNWQIRNHHNGFVFQRNNLDVPACVTDVALDVMADLGLDFGGVDVVYNQKEDRAYVLEVNTAPGIEGSTVGEYAKALVGLIHAM